LKNLITIKDANLFKRLVDLKIVPKNPERKVSLIILQHVKELDLSRAQISRAEDIRYFRNLKHLDLSNNVLKEINLSNNTKLQHVNVSHNKIESITIKGLRKLNYLDISSNSIEHIAFPDENKLLEFYAKKNKLVYLDISNCKYLRVLDISYNKLTNLDLSGTSLIYLGGEKNKITELDLNKQKKIEYVNVIGNKIRNCKLPQTNSLKYFLINGNPIEKMDSQIAGLSDIKDSVLQMNSLWTLTYQEYVLQHVNSLGNIFIECQKNETGRHCFDQMLEALFDLLMKYDKCNHFHRNEKGLIILNVYLVSILQPAFCYTSLNETVFKESDFDYSEKLCTYFEDISSLNLRDFPDVIQLIIGNKNHFFDIEEVAISDNGISYDLVFVQYREQNEMKRKTARSIIIHNT